MRGETPRAPSIKAQKLAALVPPHSLAAALNRPFFQDTQEKLLMAQAFQKISAEWKKISGASRIAEFLQFLGLFR
jgi:hypothetical protein